MMSQYVKLSITSVEADKLLGLLALHIGAQLRFHGRNHVHLREYIVLRDKLVKAMDQASVQQVRVQVLTVTPNKTGDYRELLHAGKEKR